MPSDDEIAEYYEDGVYYENKVPFSSGFFGFSCQLAQSRLRLILKHLPPQYGQRFLDIGAGNAAFGYALKEMAPEVIYDAVEPSEECRKNWGHWVSNSYSSLSEAPMQSYSVVTLNQVLEHVNRPVQFLKEIAGHLVQDGNVFIDVPHRDDLYKPTVKPHLLFWEKHSLEYAVRSVGFSPVYCESVGMKREQARGFFGQPSLKDKVMNPWRWIAGINMVLTGLGINKKLSTFGQFQADTYSGDRQWLRCLAKKMD